MSLVPRSTNRPECHEPVFSSFCRHHSSVLHLVVLLRSDFRLAFQCCFHLFHRSSFSSSLCSFPVGLCPALVSFTCVYLTCPSLCILVPFFPFAFASLLCNMLSLGFHSVLALVSWTCLLPIFRLIFWFWLWPTLDSEFASSPINKFELILLSLELM